MELLRRIDSSRHMRMMEKEFKKIRFKGVQELKDLVSFDVKFKDNGNKSRGKSLTTNDS